MSLPPAPMVMPTVAPVVINPIEQVFLALNTNPYFIGLMMLLLNLGGRFIGMEISKEQEKVFVNPWVRRALIFTVLFVATRNVFVALIMTIFVLLFLSFLFNENSDLYLWGSQKKPADKTSGGDGAPAQGMTPEETEIFRRLNEKYQRIYGATQKKEGEDEDEEPSMEQVYSMNLNKLTA